MAAHDREIRSRLQRGDRDTLVNWLLLGTTFTSRPRSIIEPTTADVVQIPAPVTQRVRDLMLPERHREAITFETVLSWFGVADQAGLLRLAHPDIKAVHC